MKRRINRVCWSIAFLVGVLSSGPVAAAPPARGGQIPADETWTLADSPIVLTVDTTILPGVTVTVEAGVVVHLQQGALLIVQGSLVGAGTPSLPIAIIGAAEYFTYLEVTGSVVLSQAIIDVQVRPTMQGSLDFTDTTFEASAHVMNLGSGWLLSLERCTFNGSYVWLSGGTIRVKDTDVFDNFLSLSGGYAHLDNVSVTNAPQWGLQLVDFLQPVYLDNLSASNPGGPGLDLIAGSFFIGSGVQLQGNAYPVQLGGAGILPGSTLPTSGNANDYVKVEFASFGAWSTIWGDAGIPYAMTGGQYHSNALEILPGVTVLLEPNFTFWDDDEVVDARGTPESPVRFEQLVPGQTWQGLQAFHRFENCVIDGSQVGARFHSNSGPGYIDNCIIQNNDFGMQNHAEVRKTRFFGNAVGAWGNVWPLGLESETNPNAFAGNGDAVQEVSGLSVDARHNWWNHPSGPNSPDNPGGMGENVTGCCVATVPFLTAAPNFSDDPPMVLLHAGPRKENAGGAYSSFVDPGTTVIIAWESQDDVAVTGHRIEFYDSWLGTWTVVAELPGGQRSFEWLVPDIGSTSNSSVPKLRVVAIDSAGQEGWDEHRFFIPTGDEPGTLTITTDLSGSPFVIGETIGPLCFDSSGIDPYAVISAEISFDSDQRHEPLGSYFNDGCLGGPGAQGPTAPFVSTDTARFSLQVSSGQNRVQYFFSDYFTVRPDPRIGDAPPAVTMTSPSGGESFPGGGVVPIAWTASDDEELRHTDVQVSTDGGRTWQFIAEGLPPAVTSFDWQLPPSAGLPDVRVRVMVSDLRFQTSSDGGDVTFEVTPGSGGGLIFADGFESGDTSAWSSTVP